MRKNKTKINGINLAVKLNAAILIVISAMIIWSIFLVREKLLKNADEMGTYLAESYAREEENRISIYSMFLNLGAVYADEYIETGAADEEIQQWMEGYSNHLSDILGTDIIDPYAVIDGKIVAAVPWEGDAGYDYTDTEWYQKALKADGETVFTNAYIDAITGKQLVTIAKKISGDGNVLAFDILMDKFHSHKNKVSIPEESSYFLYDESGKLIFLVSGFDQNNPVVEEYAQKLLEKIKNGDMASYNATITDLDNEKRAVYYYEMDNGWMSVITIPMDKILVDGWNSVILAMAGISLVLIIAILTVLVRSYLDIRRVKHTQDTLQILGDTYYAIYRINCETETYEVIKSKDDIKEELEKSRKYSHLLDVMGQIVDQETYEEFCQSFSIENIRKLVKEKTGSFGGDYQRKFGEEYRWVKVRIIYKEELGLNEVIMCFRDIDIEKKLQIQQYMLLENALESAKENVQKKSMFFSSVSHDMRTPLNAIIGLSDLAQKHFGDSKKVSDYIQKIGQAGKQLLTLINDILDISKIEQENQRLPDYSEMDIVKCMDDVMSLFTPEAERRNKNLSFKSEVENRWVYCDEYRLNQILNNLLSNAFKYTPQGADIELLLKEMSRQGNSAQYQIYVKDTGYGMSEEFLKHIFEPFARETRFAPSKIAGTGLGMPIVKSLVQQMNGEITVESRLGQGSTFVVTIPLQIAAEKETEATDCAENEAMQEDNVQDSEFTSGKLHGKNILLAEDNEINMEIAAEMLSMCGANVLKAWNGKEAVDIFRSSPEGSVDAILMDMYMPEMDGCTASETIRAMERKDASKIPIIAVTANTFAEDIAKTTRAGMNGHISKPVDFEKLMKLLAELINDSQR